MKYLKIISFFAFAIIISSCQQKIDTHNTDAVYKSQTKIFQLNEDGSIMYQYKHQLKYLTHYAFNRLHGESFIVYNPDYQGLKINKSETTMKDGKKVSSPENAYNEVLPRFAKGAPAYNHLREMVVTHTGLEVGATVDFDYELHTKGGYYDFISENIKFQKTKNLNFN